LLPMREEVKRRKKTNEQEADNGKERD